jgi:hypothetical protein
MPSRKAAYVFALTITVASRIGAQTPAPELHIKLDDALCRGVQNVSVVTNGRDNAFRAEKVSPCRWKLTGIQRHNLDISYFSLRLGGIGRTRCRRATPGHGPNIQLEFTKRGLSNARELEIVGAPVDYARDLPATRHGDVQCWEKGSVPATLFDVQLDLEDLRLRLFEKMPVACGVIVDDVATLGKAGKGDVVPITSRELVPAIVKQGLRAKSCYAPTFTPPEAVEQSLRGTARLEIKVK